MDRLVATFEYKARMFMIDTVGQVWTQEFNTRRACYEIVKIGDIDLDPDIDEENSRA